jgi:hypothetical protein
MDRILAPEPGKMRAPRIFAIKARIADIGVR